MDQFLFEAFGNRVLSGIVMTSLPLVFILLFALVAILAELKLSAFMQHRLGPMEAGPHGVLQPLADIIKLIQKESLRADSIDRWLFQAAPFLVFIGSFAAFAVVPFSPLYIGADLDVGIFYIIAVSSIVVIGIFMAGWASNNKYTLFGGIRSVAQIISYEIPAGFIILAMVMMAGTLSMQGMIEQQGGGFWNWYMFGGPKGDSTISLITGQSILTHGSGASILLAPVFLLALLIIYVCGLAETNRVPFDLPEAESELVAGYNTEYSAMKYAVFYLAEYANMFVVCAIAVTLFMGGWLPPLPKFFVQYLGIDSPIARGIEGLFWFVSKSMALVILQILLRWTLPRLRVDQLMHLCWKMFLPVGFVIVIIVAAWVTFVTPHKQHVETTVQKVNAPEPVSADLRSFGPLAPIRGVRR
ncbi:MAG: NADH-quinone oxidoreductase subunit H [bacterium]|nr:NADH-quinone oxidoreductase subunit H [Candidatus Kapabacteria bacterium]